MRRVHDLAAVEHICVPFLAGIVYISVNMDWIRNEKQGSIIEYLQ